MDILGFVNLHLVPGLVLGSIYAVGAIGVSLLFGILRFAHFAHGDLGTFGGFLALTAVWVLGIPAIQALPLAMAGAAVIAVLLDRAFYKPFRKAPSIVLVMASFGVALILRSAVQLIWGAESVSYQSGIQRPIWILDTIRIAPRHIWIIFGAAAIVVAVHLFLAYTRLGKAMRAMSDDPALARACGIDTESVIRFTWAIGAALAAAAGVFAGMDVHLHPSTGWDMMLPVFGAAILGGIGRPYGAIAGGLLMGVIEELATAPLFFGAALLPPAYKSGVAFAVLVAVLLVRPTGILRGKLF
jgi:branched-subunit amino acid ABC-type transport system permease component